MQHYTHEAKIRRNAAIGLVAMVGGMASMIVAIYLAFKRNQQQLNLVMATSFGGVIVSQVGIYLRNRWGRHPRRDEILDDALKGLDQRFSIFHYLLGASHALIAPSGVYAVCLSDIEGEVTYREGKWRQVRPRRGRPKEQQLSEPARQTQSEVNLLRRALRRRLKRDDLADLPIEPLLVFIHSNAQVEAAGAPCAATHIKKLKGFLRSLPKGPTLANEDVNALAQGLGFTPE
jgi:hypothetical protein